MSYVKARTLNYNKKQIDAIKSFKGSKYGITTMDAMYGYATYEQHYNSNPYFNGEWRDPGYTFYGDMLTYFPYYSGETLLNKLKGYESEMLETYCKGNPQALEVMIDSLNLLGWLLYEKVGGQRDEIAEWLFSEYERLMYRDWKRYVSESEMSQIYSNLN